MATTWSQTQEPQLQEQQPAGAGIGEVSMPAPNSGVASSSSSSSSSSSGGSIGPFFAVMSVLLILAFISCYVGRKCSRRETAGVKVITLSPLDRIKETGCWGWTKRKWRQCVAGEIEIGAKVTAFGEDKTIDSKLSEESIDELHQPSAH